jgi:hypothetical protein
MLRAPGSIRPTPGNFATSCSTQVEKRLINWPNQAILPSDGRPLVECRANMRGFFRSVCLSIELTYVLINKSSSIENSLFFASQGVELNQIND